MPDKILAFSTFYYSFLLPLPSVTVQYSTHNNHNYTLHVTHLHLTLPTLQLTPYTSPLTPYQPEPIPFNYNLSPYKQSTTMAAPQLPPMTAAHLSFCEGDYTIITTHIQGLSNQREDALGSMKFAPFVTAFQSSQRKARTLASVS